jgi:hypothetical protein
MRNMRHHDVVVIADSLCLAVSWFDSEKRKYCKYWWYPQYFQSKTASYHIPCNSLFITIIQCCLKPPIDVPSTSTGPHAMKAYWGSGGMAPRILDIGTRWRWVVSFTHRPLFPPGKEPLVPLDKRLGESQSWSRRCGEEINSQPLPGLDLQIIRLSDKKTSTLLGFLSPRHRTSSGCGGRRRPPDVEGICEYID